MNLDVFLPYKMENAQQNNKASTNTKFIYSGDICNYL